MSQSKIYPSELYDKITAEDYANLKQQTIGMNDSEMDEVIHKFLRAKAMITLPERKKTRIEEMIDYVNRDWKVSSWKGFKGMTGEQIFNTFIRDCHPFVFTTDTELKLAELEETEEEQDLPYPIISIETLTGYLTVPKWADSEDSITPTWTNSIVVRETSPKEYEFLLRGEYVDRETFTRSEVMFILTKKDDEKTFNLFNGLLKEFLRKIPKSKSGVVTNAFKTKVGSGKGKEFYKPKPIVVISKKETPIRSAVLGHREVEWTHRWEVRGHWAKVKGIGKDRTGNYCVPGFTWRVPHIRGPENAPLIKKTYVVKEEE